MGLFGTLILLIWQGKIRQKKKILQTKRKELYSTQSQLLTREKVFQREKKKVADLELKLQNQAQLINQEKQRNQVQNQQWESQKKELDQQTKELEQLKERLESQLHQTAQLEKEEAKKILLARWQEKLQEDLEAKTREAIKQQESRVQEQATKILCVALEKYSSSLVFSQTVNHLQVTEKKTLGRIIGKDGRNINFFRKITGADLVFDSQKRVNQQEWTIEISCFNSLRREIATRVLQRLIQEEKISPSQIEKTFEEVSQEVEKIIQTSGKEALEDLKINSVHPELVKYLGSLKFRTSYGQNVLEHCLEVAKLAGTLASELGLKVSLARRAGLFHDIGKASEDSELSHVDSGIILAKQFQEPQEVVNAIASHHGDFPINNLYSWLVIAADTLSAGRPGARGQQAEAYLNRMENLEKLAQEFNQVEKIYAFQAGKEIWVLVNAKKVSDYQLREVSQAIQAKIKEKIIVPGKVTISVLRETKFTQQMDTFSSPKQITKELYREKNSPTKAKKKKWRS